MNARFRGANLAGIILSTLVILGGLTPWGRSNGNPFAHGQALFAVFLGLLGLLVFLVVPNPAGRKYGGLVIALLVLAACWMAINEINDTTSVTNPLSFVGGESMQGGLWLTLVSAIGLLVVAIVIPTRPRTWAEPTATMTPPPAASALPTPEDWHAVTAAKAVRKLKCPRCATIVAQFGTELPTCPNCGFRPGA